MSIRSSQMDIVAGPMNLWVRVVAHLRWVVRGVSVGTSNEAPQVETKDNTIKPGDSGPVVYEEFDDLSACGHAQAGGWPPYEKSESTLH